MGVVSQHKYGRHSTDAAFPWIAAAITLLLILSNGFIGRVRGNELKADDGASSSFTITGHAHPIKFDVYEKRAKQHKRGIGYPALLPGKLAFSSAEDARSWSNATQPLQFKKDAVIARIVDPDFEARLAAEQGRLTPLWTEYESMLHLKQQQPEAMPDLMLLLKLGEALQLETDIVEKGLETALKRTIVASCDIEIIEGTRSAANINPRANDLFRYYPLTHFRFQVRIPLTNWGPDWNLDLTVNGQTARILRIDSVDLDETNEAWILGIECEPASALQRMNQSFDFELCSTPPVIQRLSEGMALYPPSCALVEKRRSYSLVAPKLSGRLYFTKPENAWVEKDEEIGGVRLAGMEALLKKVTDFRERCEAFIREARTELIPRGVMAASDSNLILVEQYFASAGRFLERASAMTIDAPETGLLTQTLDYQGPLTPETADLLACVRSPYVEVPDVVVPRNIRVDDGDIVIIRLPSGTEELAQVFRVVQETVSSEHDMSESKLISVLVRDDQFILGTTPESRPDSHGAGSSESGMPVSVHIPRYSTEAGRVRLQSKLKRAFEAPATKHAAGRSQFPIQFTFHDSVLSPLEKMAYMRLARPRSGASVDKAACYPERLAAAINEEQSPALRWAAFQRLIGQRFTSGFDLLVKIAVRGPPDVASAALFELNQKRRGFELFDVLMHLADSRGSWNATTRSQRETQFFLAYELLRGLIDHPDPRSDTLTHLIQRSRLDSGFASQLNALLYTIIQTEGANAPASMRILRGTDAGGEFLFPETAMAAAAAWAEETDHEFLRDIFHRELERRQLWGICRNTKFGYGAAFVERGFLYLRDLDKIDALVRGSENHQQDLMFLESSPYWRETCPVDSEYTLSHREIRGMPPVSASPRLIEQLDNLPCFGRDIEFAAFRQLTKEQRATRIRVLGAAKDYSTLVLLLRDPYIRRHYMGDILEWTLLAPEARFELARYYAGCKDAGILDAIDASHFESEILSDIATTVRQIESESFATAAEHGADNDPVISPSTIDVYQQLLIRFWHRTTDPVSRQNLLTLWAGLLPSGFELSDARIRQYRRALSDIPSEELAKAVHYVRQRRALKHAVARERAKRSEDTRVEIHPGPEETILRQVLQDVEAGMPPNRSAMSLLQDAIARSQIDSSDSDSNLLLRDAARLTRIRDREFATETRVRLRVEDILAYAGTIVLGPLCILAIIPLIWLARLLLLLAEAVGVGSSHSRDNFKSRLLETKRLLRTIDVPGPVRQEITGWIQSLNSNSLNLDRLARLQERVKRLMNYRGFVYRPSNTSLSSHHVSDGETPAHCPTPLDPDVAIKLAPCLTLLTTLCRLTAERICHEVPPTNGKKQRLYLLTEWFLQRSLYFSGYRYALNPLANHQIAESYIWRDVPCIQSQPSWLFLRAAKLPLNACIRVVNLLGRVFLSFPMRFVYLFTPISFLGAAVFRWSLRHLVIARGNRLEESLYPDVESLMKQTSAALRTGWAHRPAQPDQPGGRLLFSFRRIATRVLPFIIVSTVISGGFPYIYEILAGHEYTALWNLRSTGIFAALAALVLLVLTMVLHWMPLLMGWIPFDHFRNWNRARLVRRWAKGLLLTDSPWQPRGTVDADAALQVLNFQDVLKHFRAACEADSPILDLLILMVEDPARINEYRRLAQSLVSPATAVLAFPTAESMDGGGARLATLKRIDETYDDLKQSHPRLPDRFAQTRSCFVPIGKDCDPCLELPVLIDAPSSPPDADPTPLTPFALSIANAQALMRKSFVYNENGETKRFVGSVTVTPQRLYLGPYNVDQGGRFRGGITLVGAFESIDLAGEQGALAIMGRRAFIRSSTDQLRDIIRKHPDLNLWLDPDNTRKRQLPVAQLVIERFRTAERYGRHIKTCIRYIDQIQRIKHDLLTDGPLHEFDVGDADFLDGVAIHYMRHLIVPWLIAYQGGSLEKYEASVLTGDLSVLDRRRAFHHRVLQLVELFQEEGRMAKRQLPKVRFVSAPTARIAYAKTSHDAEIFWQHPDRLFPTTLTLATSRPRRPAVARLSPTPEEKPPSSLLAR